MNIVQYIIVREDLIKTFQWPLGALIAQCCHATTAISYSCRDDSETKEYFKDLDNMHKVVLKINNEEELRSLSSTLTNSKIDHKLWIEQPENIPTCIAIKPYNKKIVNKFVKSLKLYK